MKFIYFFVIVFLFSSCISKKKIEYLQDKNTVKSFRLSELKDGDILFKKPEEHRISSNDELLIKVSSFDDVSFNYFNIQGASSTIQASNEMSLSMISYSVDVDGYIDFPIVGKIKLRGLKLEEAKVKIQEILSPYFNQPNVQIKYAFKKITVIGAVNYPGSFTYTQDQVTIFEALAMARDMTIHGNRKEVLIIRKIDNNTANKYVVDLTDDSSVFGYNYYLQPDDVVYVKPRKSANWSVISTPVTLIFSTITTVLLVFNALKD